MIYVSHLLEDEEMRKICQKYETGVEAIEFSIGENLTDPSASLESYPKRWEYMEGKNLIFHGPFWDLSPTSYDSGIAKVSYKRYDTAFQAAKTMGIKKMIYHTCLMPDGYILDDWIKRTVAFWREFLETHTGITICFENVLDRQIWPMAEVAKAVDHPQFGICLDIGHAEAYSAIPAEDWARELKPWINHLHVHDNFGDRDAHLALGEGRIDLKQVFDVLNIREEPLDITIENTSLADVETSLHWLQEYLAQEEN
ncbi:MAG: sugar phosphate isomerase/epimerase family protein [Lachnospiraceae bacterium]